MSNDFNNPYATPANLGPTFGQAMGPPPLASLGKRFLGAIADLAVSFVVMLPGLVALIIGAVKSTEQEPSPILFVGIGLILLAALVLMGIQIYLLATSWQVLGENSDS